MNLATLAAGWGATSATGRMVDRLSCWTDRPQSHPTSRRELTGRAHLARRQVVRQVTRTPREIAPSWSDATG